MSFFPDAHLEGRLVDAEAAACARLPLRFQWNDGGLWVGHGSGAIPTGSRVTHLGTLSVAELESELALRIPHEVPQWVRAHGADLLPRIDTLRFLGVIGRTGTVRVGFVTPSGKPGNANLPTQVAATVTPQRPWVGYEIHAKQRTGYFRFDRFEYDAEFAATLDKFLTAADAAAVTRIAIDIRGNPGGDSSVAVAILDALGFDSYAAFTVVPRPSPALAQGIPPLMPAALNPMLEQFGLPPIPLDAPTYVLAPPLVLAQLRGRVAALPPLHHLKAQPQLFLLTDAGTFSSGTLFTELVRDNHLGRLVGQAPGNSASFNGTEQHIDLPGTPYYLNLTMARLLRPDVGADGAASLEPDVPIEVTGADLAAGRDPALEYVLRLGNEPRTLRRADL